MAEQAHKIEGAPGTAAGDRPEPRLALQRVERGTRRFLGLTYGQAGLLGAIVLAVQLPFILYALRGEPSASAAVPFQDDFNRGELGSGYFTTGGHWRIEEGVLHSPGVKNNPLWLEAPLPEDVAVEFDARSESNDGDIKCEIFGNGRDHSSGYVIILGGWSNSVSVLARLDEHGRDRIENRSFKIEKSRTYRIRIESRAGSLRAFADGQLILQLDDKKPLRGKGHDRFGFSSWDSDLFFDNLKIDRL